MVATKRKRSIPLLISAILGVAYAIYIIVYFGSVGSNAQNVSEAIGTGIATALVLPHIICTVIAVIFNILAWALNKKAFALVAGILYAVAAVLFFLYALFVIVQMILCFVGFAKLRKAPITSNLLNSGNEITPSPQNGISVEPIKEHSDPEETTIMRHAANRDSNERKITVLGTVAFIVAALLVVSGTALAAIKADRNILKTVPVQNQSSLSSCLSIASNETQDIHFGWNRAHSSAEEGTTARVDEIWFKAYDDVKNIENAEPLLDECIKYLKDHVNNLYENNEVMEKSMYYGFFIYNYIEKNAGVDNVSELPNDTRNIYEAGYNTQKAIKYVYRGVDKIDDESTQNALEKVKTALNNIE